MVELSDDAEGTGAVAAGAGVGGAGIAIDVTDAPPAAGRVLYGGIINPSAP